MPKMSSNTMCFKVVLYTAVSSAYASASKPSGKLIRKVPVRPTTTSATPSPSATPTGT